MARPRYWDMADLIGGFIYVWRAFFCFVTRSRYRNMGWSIERPVYTLEGVIATRSRCNSLVGVIGGVICTFLDGVPLDLVGPVALICARENKSQ